MIGKKGKKADDDREEPVHGNRKEPDENRKQPLHNDRKKPLPIGRRVGKAYSKTSVAKAADQGHEVIIAFSSPSLNLNPRANNVNVA